MTKLLLVLAVLLLLPALLYFLQDSMIYFPRAYNTAFLETKRNEIVHISSSTNAGKQVSFYVGRQLDQGLVPEELWIVFGGNASLALDWLSFVRGYPSQSSGFLLIDYPGYGLSQGRPSPESILETSVAGFQALAQYFKVDVSVLAKHINILGHSLGAAAATEFATKYPPKKLILISPFTSALEMAKKAVGVPLCYLLRHRFDNRARLQEIVQARTTQRITIIHGEHDEIIPVRMGRELGKLFAKHVHYLEIEHADHNGLLASAEELIYKTMLDN